MFRRQPNDHQRRNPLVSEIFVKTGSNKGAIHRFVELFFLGLRLHLRVRPGISHCFFRSLTTFMARGCRLARQSQVWQQKCLPRSPVRFAICDSVMPTNLNSPKSLNLFWARLSGMIQGKCIACVSHSGIRSYAWFTSQGYGSTLQPANGHAVLETPAGLVGTRLTVSRSPFSPSVWR